MEKIVVYSKDDSCKMKDANPHSQRKEIHIGYTYSENEINGFGPLNSKAQINTNFWST